MTAEEADPPRVIGLADSGRRMSIEDFDALTMDNVDELYHYEWIDGSLFVQNFPDMAEAAVIEGLGYWFWKYSQNDERGQVLDAHFSRRTVPNINRRLADRLLWIDLGRLPNEANDPPTVVIDIVPTSRHRDLAAQRHEYMAFGVQEYGIFDRKSRTLTVIRPDQADRVVPESETYQTPLLPGFGLPLSRMLATADRWDETS